MKKTFITLLSIAALAFVFTTVPVNAQGQTLLEQLEDILSINSDNELESSSTIKAPALKIGEHTITENEDGSLCIGACSEDTTEPEPLTWAGATADITSALDDYYTANGNYPATMEYYPQNDADSVFEALLDSLDLDNSNADIIASVPSSIGTMIFYGYDNETSNAKCPDQEENSYAFTFDANESVEGHDDHKYNTAGSWHFYCMTGADNPSSN